MKERGILMSAPMVRAILDGRKSVTRRIVRFHDGFAPQHYDACYPHPNGGWIFTDKTFAREDVERLAITGRGFRCPYGAKGDRLWVKETAWISRERFADQQFATHPNGRIVQYAATHPDSEGPDSFGVKKTPSIFMPRWASRITLEVTDVRVERLQEITEDDAKAEGVDDAFIRQRLHGASQPARVAFAALWDEINGERAAWATNPWVWRVAFRRVEESTRGS